MLAETVSLLKKVQTSLDSEKFLERKDRERRGSWKEHSLPIRVEPLRQRNEITEFQHLLGSVSRKAQHGGNAYEEAPQPGKCNLNVRKNRLQIPVVQSLCVSQILGHIGYFGSDGCPFSKIDNFLMSHGRKVFQME